MNTPTDDDRSRRARALFDAQVEALDGPTATALRARRREALVAMTAPRRASWAWPVSGVATAALALALWLPRSDGIGDEAPPAGAGERVVVAPAPSPDATTETDTTTAARFADGALAELDEDAEFYAWLATVPADDTDTTALPAQGTPEGWTL